LIYKAVYPIIGKNTNALQFLKCYEFRRGWQILYKMEWDFQYYTKSVVNFHRCKPARLFRTKNIFGTHGTTLGTTYLFTAINKERYSTEISQIIWHWRKCFWLKVTWQDIAQKLFRVSTAEYSKMPRQATAVCYKWFVLPLSKNLSKYSFHSLKTSALDPGPLSINFFITFASFWPFLHFSYKPGWRAGVHKSQTSWVRYLSTFLHHFLHLIFYSKFFFLIFGEKMGLKYWCKNEKSKNMENKFWFVKKRKKYM